MTNLNWNELTFGVYSQEQIQSAVKHEDWQLWRKRLKGMGLRERFLLLRMWVEYMTAMGKQEQGFIQVTNYVNALRRAGMVDKK